jgi:hypothetical protein
MIREETVLRASALQDSFADESLANAHTRRMDIGGTSVVASSFPLPVTQIGPKPVYVGKGLLGELLAYTGRIKFV